MAFIRPMRACAFRVRSAPLRISVVLLVVVSAIACAERAVAPPHHPTPRPAPRQRLINVLASEAGFLRMLERGVRHVCDGAADPLEAFSSEELRLLRGYRDQVSRGRDEALAWNETFSGAAWLVAHDVHVRNALALTHALIDPDELERAASAADLSRCDWLLVKAEDCRASLRAASRVARDLPPEPTAPRLLP